MPVLYLTPLSHFSRKCRIVLREIGLTSEQIEALKRRGIVAGGQP